MSMDYADIAREAYEKVAVGPRRKTNYAFEQPSEEGLIAATQAVRASVIEECAKLCDELGDRDLSAKYAADRLRALKDKR